MIEPSWAGACVWCAVPRASESGPWPGVRTLDAGWVDEPSLRPSADLAVECWRAGGCAAVRFGQKCCSLLHRSSSAGAVHATLLPRARAVAEQRHAGTGSGPCSAPGGRFGTRSSLRTYANCWAHGVEPASAGGTATGCLPPICCSLRALLRAHARTVPSLRRRDRHSRNTPYLVTCDCTLLTRERAGNGAVGGAAAGWVLRQAKQWAVARWECGKWVGRCRTDAQSLMLSGPVTSYTLCKIALR